jgi:hypothetical protein
LIILLLPVTTHHAAVTALCRPDIIWSSIMRHHALAPTHEDMRGISYQWSYLAELSLQYLDSII